MLLQMHLRFVVAIVMHPSGQNTVRVYLQNSSCAFHKSNQNLPSLGQGVEGIDFAVFPKLSSCVQHEQHVSE